MSSNDNLIGATFKTVPVENPTKSHKSGRPMFDDMEIVEIRMAANKQTVGVFPAHEVWKIVDQPDGAREPVTYAQRFKDQYVKFKNNEAQSQSGTPLAELPFLTQAKRSELKALNIHTAETLAALDGHPLKVLGPGGRELKNKAQAYIENAAGSADTLRLIAENEAMKTQLNAMQKQMNDLVGAAPRVPSTAVESDDETGSEDDDAEDDPAEEVSTFQMWEDVEIKNFIKDRTGTAPKGNPNHETLVRMADEIVAKEIAEDGE